MHPDRLRRSADLKQFPATLLPLAAGLALIVGALAGPALPARAAPASQDGTEGQTIFQSRCAACHTIGQGKLVGPDLKDVTARRDDRWIRDFIREPDKMFAANDSTAQQLLQEFGGVKMPTPGLSAEEMEALMAYLANTSPVTAAKEPLPAGNPGAGRLLFTGEMALSNGGPACIGCHNVRGAGSLGGGLLGPDLTHVTQGYGDAGLAAALGNIAFPSMVGPFAKRPLTPWEQAGLVAFLKQADQSQIPARGQQPPVSAAAGVFTGNTAWFLGIGLAGAIALSALLLAFWRGQGESVSSRLRGNRRPGDDARGTLK